MLVVGFDPGKQGFMCAFDTESCRARLVKLTYKEGILDFRPIERIFKRKPDFVYIEKLMDGKQGGNSNIQSKSSGFLMGFYYGQLRQAISRTGWDYRLVHPRTWQAMIHIQKKEGSAKQRTIDAYKHYYPHLPIQPSRFGNFNDNKVDAMMIATYAVLIEGFGVKRWEFPEKVLRRKKNG